MKALLLSAPEICKLQDEKVRLEGEVKMLREALQFYATLDWKENTEAWQAVAKQTLSMTEEK